MKWLLVSNGSEQQGTTRLFATLAEHLRDEGHEVALVPRKFPAGVISKLPLLVPGRDMIRALRRSDVLLVHTAVALSLAPIIMARLLRRRVCAFGWDLYPESWGSPTGWRRLMFWAYSLAERTGLRLAHDVLVPSRDYLPFFPAKSELLPLWPCDDWVEAPAPPPRQEGVLQVVFAGQMNPIRGFGAALQRLSSWCGESGKIHLHVFADKSPGELVIPANIEIENHGYVAPAELARQLASSDFGLVCLNESFPLPAYPHKLGNYVASGVPVIYCGPKLGAISDDLVEYGLGIDLSVGAPQAVSGERFSFAEFLDGRDRYREHWQEGMKRFAALY